MQLRKRRHTHAVPQCSASHSRLSPFSPPKEFGPEGFPSLNLHSPKPILTVKSEGSLVETQHALTDPLAGRGSGDGAISNTTNSTDASLCGGDIFVCVILSLLFASELNPGPLVRATADLIRSTWSARLLAVLRIDLGSYRSSLPPSMCRSDSQLNYSTFQVLNYMFTFFYSIIMFLINYSLLFYNEIFKSNYY